MLDPQDPSTFERSKVNHDLLKEPPNRAIFQYYRRLIELRKAHPALKNLDRKQMEVRQLDDKSTLIVRRWETGVEELATVYVMGSKAVRLDPFPGGWTRVFDSGDGAPEHTGGVGRCVSPRLLIPRVHRAHALQRDGLRPLFFSRTLEPGGTTHRLTGGDPESGGGTIGRTTRARPWVDVWRFHDIPDLDMRTGRCGRGPMRLSLRASPADQPAVPPHETFLNPHGLLGGRSNPLAAPRWKVVLTI